MNARLDRWARLQAARLADWLDRLGDRLHQMAGVSRGWAGR